MADDLILIRNLLIAEAQRRKGPFLIGPQKRINQAQLARAIGVDKSWVSRVMNEKPSQRPNSAYTDWHVDGEVLEKLRIFLGAVTKAHFWEMAERMDAEDGPEGQPRPPHRSRRRRRRKREEE